MKLKQIEGLTRVPFSQIPVTGVFAYGECVYVRLPSGLLQDKKEVNAMDVEYEDVYCFSAYDIVIWDKDARIETKLYIPVSLK